MSNLNAYMRFFCAVLCCFAEICLLFEFKLISLDIDFPFNLTSWINDLFKAFVTESFLSSSQDVSNNLSSCAIVKMHFSQTATSKILQTTFYHLHYHYISIDWRSSYKSFPNVNQIKVKTPYREMISQFWKIVSSSLRTCILLQVSLRMQTLCLQPSHPVVPLHCKNSNTIEK